MTKKQLRAFQKQLRQSPPTKPAELKLPAIPASVNLSPEQQRRLLAELGDLAADIHKLFYRASLKMMIAGLKAGSDSSAR